MLSYSSVADRGWGEELPVSASPSFSCQQESHQHSEKTLIQRGFSEIAALELSIAISIISNPVVNKRNTFFSSRVESSLQNFLLGLLQINCRLFVLSEVTPLRGACQVGTKR